MNWLCLLGHRWRGCQCERCHEVRDQQHAWEHCKCRRCGLNRHSDHDWHRCACRSCGAERHQWKEGVCVQCGLQCTHEEQPAGGSPVDSVMTVHGALQWVCQRCGSTVGEDAGRR